MSSKNISDFALGTNGIDPMIYEGNDPYANNPFQPGLTLDGINSTSSMNPMSSAFNSIMGKDSWGSNLLGLGLAGFAAYDANKTNKLNRKVTNATLDRFLAENKRYDQFHNDVGNMDFRSKPSAFSTTA